MGDHVTLHDMELTAWIMDFYIPAAIMQGSMHESNDELLVNVALMTVLYRDLPRYNDRRRNLWLPEIVHQHVGSLCRTVSNPSLYGLDHPDSRYSALVDAVSTWSGGSCGESRGMRGRRADSMQSLISNSTGSFPSNYCSAHLLLDCSVVKTSLSVC